VPAAALESTRDRENISFDEDFSRRARIIYVKKKSLRDHWTDMPARRATCAHWD
jgi:hypothetical protein